MKSIFLDKDAEPTITDLKNAVDDTYGIWRELIEHTKGLYPAAIEEWNFSSAKYGWSYRVKDKKKVLLYLLPRDKFFKVAFVFGQKATDKVLKSSVSESIKAELRDAKVYAEGRGIRIDILDDSLSGDIKQLIAIKISN